MTFATGTTRGGQGVPSGASGHGDPGDPAGPGDTVSPGVPGNVGDLADPRAPDSGESGGAASAIPHTLGTPHAPGPGADAAPGVGVLEPSGCILFQEPRWSWWSWMSRSGLGMVHGNVVGGA